MTVEVELKARVADPELTRSRLKSRATGEPSTYHDTYYDWPDHRLTDAGRQELRLRIVTSEQTTHCILTYKGAATSATDTPEYETDVADSATLDSILAHLGLTHLISYTKNCLNYQFSAHGYPMLATLAQVPELDAVFLEVETVIPDTTSSDTAVTAIHQTLTDLGLGEDDLDPTFYIDMVTAARGDLTTSKTATEPTHPFTGVGTDGVSNTHSVSR
jgi:adenylate cyclase class 2